MEYRDRFSVPFAGDMMTPRTNNRIEGNRQEEKLVEIEVLKHTVRMEKLMINLRIQRIPKCNRTLSF